METREGFIVRPNPLWTGLFGGEPFLRPVKCKVLCEHRGTYWVQVGDNETKEIYKEDFFSTKDEARLEIRLKEIEIKICSLERRLSEKVKKHSFWG